MTFIIKAGLNQYFQNIPEQLLVFCMPLMTVVSFWPVLPRECCPPLMIVFIVLGGPLLNMAGTASTLMNGFVFKPIDWLWMFVLQSNLQSILWG